MAAPFIPKNSKWLGWRNLKPSTLEVTSLWCRGGGENYKVVSLELQPEGSDEIITLPYEQMIALIEEKKLQRVY